jgi:hypothetical protein
MLSVCRQFQALGNAANDDAAHDEAHLGAKLELHVPAREAIRGRDELGSDVAVAEALPVHPRSRKDMPAPYMRASSMLYEPLRESDRHNFVDPKTKRR